MATLREQTVTKKRGQAKVNTPAKMREKALNQKAKNRRARKGNVEKRKRRRGSNQNMPTKAGTEG